MGSLRCLLTGCFRLTPVFRSVSPRHSHCQRRSNGSVQSARGISVGSCCFLHVVMHARHSCTARALFFFFLAALPGVSSNPPPQSHPVSSHPLEPPTKPLRKLTILATARLRIARPPPSPPSFPKGCQHATDPSGLAGPSAFACCGRSALTRPPNLDQVAGESLEASPPNPSCWTLIVARSTANLTVLCTPQFPVRHSRPYITPATKVSPAPMALPEVCSVVSPAF